MYNIKSTSKWLYFGAQSSCCSQMPNKQGLITGNVSVTCVTPVPSSDRTLLPTDEERGGRECGDEVSYTAILALLGPGGKGNCSFIEGLSEQNKKETKDSPPGPPPGEGVVRSPSPEEQDPKAPGRPSQGRRLPWRFMGLEGAEAGCTGLLRPAPRCGHSEGCCCGRAGAEVEAAGGRPRRRADGGAAAGGGGGDSSGPPGQDVTKCLRLLLCGGELLGKVLHRFAE